MEIKDQPDAVSAAEWKCREDEPVRNAVCMDNVDGMLAVDAQQLTCGKDRESTVLHDVGADPRPLMSLNWLAVELCTIELATT